MRRLLAAAFLVLSLYAGAQEKMTDYPFFSALQLQQDFDSLYTALKENHPDLYANWKKTDADAAYRLIKKQLNKPMNRLQFVNIISPFIARFDDGHTFLSTFDIEEVESYWKSGGKMFPLQVSIIDGKLYCAGNAFGKGSIEAGDEIITINGTPSAILVKKLSSFWSADGRENAIATAQRLFGFGLWLNYGWGSSTEVTFLRGKQKVKEVIEGITKDPFLSLQYGSGPIRRLQLLPEHSLAVVEIRSYGNVEKSKAFIDSVFGIIKMHNIQHVALDLRKNGGGNSYIGDYFISYISRKPYRTISSKTWRVGPMLQSLPAEHWMTNSLNYARNNWSLKEDYLQSPVLEAQQPTSVNDTSLYSTARFYLLTSARTYSSAHMTAMAVKCGKLGTIIGQPTGERLDFTGEILEKILPNTKVVAVIPSATYKAGCESSKGIGVIPDYYVPIKASDLKNGRDAELEFLKTLIKKEE